MGVEVGSEFELPQTRRKAVVRRFIGEGSQGAVFDVVVEPSGHHHALKWYFEASGNDRQRAAIEELIERGSPDPRFLWPTELVTMPGESSFGYLMPLRDHTTVGLADLLNGRVDVPFSTICMLGMELADSMLALHSQGLCYRDISFGNVFFDPRTGRPLICDNDNVGVDGLSTSAVLGTRKFMAPEIVRREAAPSTTTDLYSLSVMLFYLLMVGHPLIGRRELEFGPWDDHVESILFGSEPLFVFDPDNDANRPLPELHLSMISNWELFPSYVHDLFTKAFTVGLGDPVNGRVRESIWRSTLSRLRDSIVRCPACSKESFWLGPDVSSRCWSCDRALPDPVRLEVNGNALVLNQGSMVYPHHLRLNYDFGSPVGQVVSHPTKPDRWGLRNDTSEAWSVIVGDGDPVPVDPGRTVGLIPDSQIVMGSVTARVAR